MATLIHKLKGTCDDCRLESDKTEDCVVEQCIVDEYRTANPCGCSCIEMGFEVCPILVPQEDCLCQDGVTHSPGNIIGGAYIGFVQPLGKTLTEIAAITSPDDPHAYYTFYGANSGTDIACPISTAGWDLISQDGNATVVDYGDVPIVRAGDVCVSGAFTLSVDDCLITTTDAEKCLQTGGRRAFLMEVTDGAGHLLVLCPMTGISVLTQCDRQPCCSYNITQILTPCGEDGTAHIRMVCELDNSDCVCGVVEVVTIEGTDYPLSGSETIIDHDVPVCAYLATNPIACSISISYPDCADETCVDSFNEFVINV